MISDITLGQFFPGNSILHRLDPRMKIVIAVLYIVLCFLCKNVLTFGLLLLSALLLIVFSRIPIKVVLRSIKAIIFIMLFTAILNIFWTTGKAEELLFSWKFISIYSSAIILIILSLSSFAVISSL